MQDSYTENFSYFGSRERAEAAKLLALPLPQGFYDDVVKLAFNRTSGFVFLVNSDYQVAMVNDETGFLEIWHFTPYNGVEGFLSDLLQRDPGEYHEDDAEYIRNAADTEGAELPDNWKIMGEIENEKNQSKDTSRI